MKEKNNFKSAFTLAEVLVTLGIIGIVAAMTIPTLQAKYQKQEYVTRLKKAYATINQALIELFSDMGCPESLECTGLFNEYSIATFGDEFVKKFKTLKNCGSEHYLSTNCFSTQIAYEYDGGGTKMYPIFIGGGLNDSNVYNFITVDGTSIGLKVYANQSFPNTLNANISVMIDVNGLKPPNNMGRDVFGFFIRSRPFLYPVGAKISITDNDNYWWNGPSKSCVSNNKAGSLCAGRIMEEGWQMNY